MRSVQIEGCVATITRTTAGSTAGSAASSTCESDFTKMNYGDREVCFINFEDSLPSESLETCGSVGATHVLPANEAENMDLLAFMNDQGLEWAAINLNDANEEGVWVSNDGSPTTPWRNWENNDYFAEYHNLDYYYGEENLDFVLFDNYHSSLKGEWIVGPNIPFNIICYKPVSQSQN